MIFPHTVDMELFEGKRRYRRLLAAADSHRNRIFFLSRCIEEKVIPRCIPSKLLSKEHIFPQIIKDHLQDSIAQLRLELPTIIDDTNQIKVLLIQKRQLSNAENNNILRKNQRQSLIQQNKLQNKLRRLCESSKWSSVGRKDLVKNISSYKLTNTDLEALSLGFKFATGQNNNYITNLINTNYRHSDTDFNKPKTIWSPDGCF